MTEIVVRVGGMMCSGCAKNVEQALMTLPGIASVEVDVKKGEVKVLMDGSLTTMEQVKTKIKAAGYQPDPPRKMMH